MTRIRTEQESKVEYIIKCSEQEFDIIKMCIISALNTFEELEYTQSELDFLVDGMSLKKIDEMLNVLYNCPF